MRLLIAFIIGTIVSFSLPLHALGGIGWGIEVDKGCGSVYLTGDEVTITYRVGEYSLVEVMEKFINESIILFRGYRAPGTYVIKGTLGDVPGPRTFEIYEVKYGVPSLKASCSIKVSRRGEVPLMVIVIVNLTRDGVITRGLYSPLMIGWKEFLRDYFSKNSGNYFKELRNLLSSMFGLREGYKLTENKTYLFYDSEVAEDRLGSVGVTLEFNFTCSEYFSVEGAEYVLSFKDPLKEKGRGWVDWVIINVPKYITIKEVSPLTTLDCLSESKVAWYNPSLDRAPSRYTVKFLIRG